MKFFAKVKFCLCFLGSIGEQNTANNEQSSFECLPVKEEIDSEEFQTLLCFKAEICHGKQAVKWKIRKMMVRNYSSIATNK